MNINTLKKSSEFKSVLSNGKKSVAKGLILYALPTPKNINLTDEENYIRVGYIASKKVGNAVERNKIKRRFRVLVKEIIENFAKKSHDYVIVGRKAALDREFDSLRKDLKFALHDTGLFKDK